MLKLVFKYVFNKKKYKRLQKDFSMLKRQYIKVISDNSRLSILNHKYKLIILKKRNIDWSDYEELEQLL